MTGQWTCTPDPGPTIPANCAVAEQALELVTLGDFSQDQAKRWYAYVDKSGEGRVWSFNKGWEANTTADPFPRCGDHPGKSLRIQGGPFYGWGGGFGTSMKDFVGPPDPPYDCFRYPDMPLCLPTDYEFVSTMVDASRFEGVALWARRGPDSQGGIRVNVGDVNTDDDISYLMYQTDPARKRNCERVRECACTNHKPCTTWATSPLDTQTPNLMAWKKSIADQNVEPYQLWSCANPGSYCEDPAADIIPGYFTTAGPLARCNTCEQTRCDEQYEAYPDGAGSSAGIKDAQFNGKPCTAHTVRSGVTSAYCYDPKVDPVPAESDEQCGDHWMRGIYLTNNWQLHLVPFSTMLQQGFGKRFGKMDTSHVTMVRLTWDGGYVDFWIGWVGFYRHTSR